MTATAVASATDPGSTPAPGRPRLLNFTCARSTRVIWRWWWVTRAVGFAAVMTALIHGWPLRTEDLASDPHYIYLSAHRLLLLHYFPYSGFSFPYPPGALLPMIFPPGQSTFGAFLPIYALEMLAIDATIMRVLLRSGLPRVGQASWLWVTGGGATLGLMLCRLDIVAALPVVLALLAFGRSRPGRAGGWLAFGASVKLWPVFLLAPMIAGWPAVTKRLLLGASIVAELALAPIVAAGAFGSLWRDVVGYHGGRGVEIEAVAALPTVLVDAVRGRGVRSTQDHGSTNLAHSLTLGTVCTALTVLVVVACTWLVWRVRRRTGGVAMPTLMLASCTLVCLTLLTSKVFSPQYLMWLLPVAVVALGYGAIDASAAVLVTAAVLLTTVVFPFSFATDLGRPAFTALFPAVGLLARDAVLLVLCARWLGGLWRAGRPLPAAPLLTGELTEGTAHGTAISGR